MQKRKIGNSNKDNTHPSIRISEAAHKNHEELFPNYKIALSPTMEVRRSLGVSRPK